MYAPTAGGRREGGRREGGRESGIRELVPQFMLFFFFLQMNREIICPLLLSFSTLSYQIAALTFLFLGFICHKKRRGGGRGKGGKGNTSLLYIQGDLCTTQNGKEKIQFLLLLLASSSSTPHFCSCPPPQAPSPLGLGVSTSFFLLHKRKYLITTYGVTSEQQYSLLLSSSASSSNQHFDCYSPLRLFLRLGF